MRFDTVDWVVFNLAAARSNVPSCEIQYSASTCFRLNMACDFPCRFIPEMNGSAVDNITFISFVRGDIFLETIKTKTCAVPTLSRLTGEQRCGGMSASGQASPNIRVRRGEDFMSGFRPS